jgi:hypothetical protein
MVSVVMARAQKKPVERRRERRDKGLLGLEVDEGEKGEAYCRQKWGRRGRPGMSRNAGNVMRLNTPTTIRKPRMELEKAEAWLCGCG